MIISLRLGIPVTFIFKVPTETTTYIIIQNNTDLPSSLTRTITIIMSKWYSPRNLICFENSSEVVFSMLQPWVSVILWKIGFSAALGIKFDGLPGKLHSLYFEFTRVRCIYTNSIKLHIVGMKIIIYLFVNLTFIPVELLVNKFMSRIIHRLTLHGINLG